MPSEILEVQKALYAAADAVLSVPVFDTWGAADGTSPPYVCLETFMARAADSKAEVGSNVWARFHVFSAKNGRSEAALITEQIRAALHRADVPVPGFSVTWCRHEDTTASDDPGGTSQLISTYTLHLNPAP